MSQFSLKYVLKKLHQMVFRPSRPILKGGSPVTHGIATLPEDEASDTHEIVALAQALGSADAAIVVWKIQAWLALNEAARSRDHYHEERWWIYASVRELREDHFTWMSEAQLARLMTKLAERKVLIRQKLKIEGEQSYWYSIDEAVLEALIEKNVVDLSRQIYQASDIPMAFEHFYIRGSHREEPRPQEARQPGAGYVYLLQATTGLYKIGLSGNAERRLKDFEGLPFDVSYVCVIESPDMRALEAFLHKRFAAKRVKGEWFDLNAEDVDYIRSLTLEGF